MFCILGEITLFTSGAALSALPLHGFMASPPSAIKELQLFFAGIHTRVSAAGAVNSCKSHFKSRFYFQAFVRVLKTQLLI